MGLESSSVHRKLDHKVKIVGLEVNDLLFLLLLASIMNLFFGRTAIAFYVVFLLPTVLGTVLFLGKRNKPDKYLIHLFRYYIVPQSFCGGGNSQDEELRKRRIIE